MNLDGYLRKRNKLFSEIKNLDMLYIMENCKIKRGDVVELNGEKIYISSVNVVKNGKFTGMYHLVEDGRMKKEFKIFTNEDYKQMKKIKLW